MMRIVTPLRAVAVFGVVGFSYIGFLYANAFGLSIFASRDDPSIQPLRLLLANISQPLPNPEFRPPFSTKGRHILDTNDTIVQLKSVNWYGASDINFVPTGLDIQHRNDTAKLIRLMGFNSVRLPYADEIVTTNPLIPDIWLKANPDLMGQRALSIYSAVVKSLTDAGLYVIPNNHITRATWCCGINLCDSTWNNDLLIPFCKYRQTEENWIQNWENVAGRFVSNPFVIGMDLRNEVRGIWGTMPWSSWASAVEEVSERLLKLNKDWLMIVEGVSSANDLSGVKRRPVKLSVKDRVLYSSHVYSWSGWGELTPYRKASYSTFSNAMRRNWAYLIEEDIAPVWLGEFGTGDHPTVGDMNYWKHLIRFMSEELHNNASWGWWAINPRKPADTEYQHETYGLVTDDWEHVRWNFRLEGLQKMGLNTSMIWSQPDVEFISTAQKELKFQA